MTILNILAAALSLGGVAAMIASAFVRRRWARGGVWCFWLGIFAMHLGNTWRHWLDSLQDRAELQAKFAALTPAEQLAPSGRFLAQWLAEKMAQPPVDVIQWLMLAVGVIGAAIALARPEWLMAPQDRARLGLDPILGPRIGGAA